MFGLIGKQLCRKGPCGHQAEHESAMCHYGKKRQLSPELHEDEYCHQVRIDDPSLLSTGKAIPGVLDPVLSSPVQETQTCWREFSESEGAGSISPGEKEAQE